MTSFICLFLAADSALALRADSYQKMAIAKWKKYKQENKIMQIQ